MSEISDSRHNKLSSKYTGCLSANINIDDGYPIHIVRNGENNDLLYDEAIRAVLLYPTYDISTVRIGFEVDESFERNKIYIHTQLNIQFLSLLSSDTVSIITHYLYST